MLYGVTSASVLGTIFRSGVSNVKTMSIGRNSDIFWAFIFNIVLKVRIYIKKHLQTRQRTIDQTKVVLSSDSVNKSQEREISLSSETSNDSSSPTIGTAKKVIALLLLTCVQRLKISKAVCNNFVFPIRSDCNER